MGLVSLRFRRWVTRVCTFFNIKTNGKSEHLLNLIPTDKHSQVTYCVSSLDQVKKYLRKIRYFKKFVFFIHNSRTNMIEMFQNLNPEAVIQRCSIKQVLLKISQNSHDNTCARFSFLKRGFIKKEALAQVFFCEFCKTFQNTFFNLQNTSGRLPQ